MQHKACALFLIVLTVSQPSAVRAADDTPAAKLAVLQRVLATENKNNAKHRAASVEAARILKDMQNRLVVQTAKLRGIEQDAAALTERRTVTEQAVQASRDNLTRHHAVLAQMLMAAGRLQRVPPEAMLLRPGAPIDAARTHLLLQNATPELARQSVALRAELAKLGTLQAELDQQSQELAALRQTQTNRQNTLTADIRTREKLLATTQAQTAQSDTTLADLKKQESGLKQILADLTQRQQTPASRPARKVPSARPATVPDEAGKDDSWSGSLFSIFKGRTRPVTRTAALPVTGRVRTDYNEKLASGARSQGLYIAAGPGGIVTSVADGTVRFAGPFRQYRLLVIIEHRNGYHSLLGGLHDVYHRPGDTVAAGEPIGKLDSDAAHANLYYEVRRDGKPVDPGQLRG